MDDFYERLKDIDRDKLKGRLLSLASPCYESELYRVAFPGALISGSDPLALYQNHFLLFHVLYRMQEEFYAEGKYLHVHFMRTFLIDYPPAGSCRFYEEHSARFCEEACREGKSYCGFHEEIVGESEVEELSAKYFYLDAENFYRLDGETAEAFIRGAWETLKHYDDYRESFALLCLPESADADMIKKRFRELAKKYHPDKGAESHEKFNEINRAYRLLVRLRGG